MLLISGYFVLCHPTPLRLQEIVAMHSIKLAMGSVAQKKLASAIRVWLKHLISKEVIQLYAVEFRVFCPLSPNPTPCVYKKL